MEALDTLRRIAQGPHGGRADGAFRFVQLPRRHREIPCRHPHAVEALRELQQRRVALLPYGVHDLLDPTVDLRVDGGRRPVESLGHPGCAQDGRVHAPDHLSTRLAALGSNFICSPLAACPLSVR
jgi:hypothetical protein